MKKMVSCVVVAALLVAGGGGQIATAAAAEFEGKGEPIPQITPLVEPQAPILDPAVGLNAVSALPTGLEAATQELAAQPALAGMRDAVAQTAQPSVGAQVARLAASPAVMTMTSQDARVDTARRVEASRTFFDRALSAKAGAGSWVMGEARAAFAQSLSPSARHGASRPGDGSVAPWRAKARAGSAASEGAPERSRSARVASAALGALFIPITLLGRATSAATTAISKVTGAPREWAALMGAGVPLLAAIILQMTPAVLFPAAILGVAFTAQSIKASAARQASGADFIAENSREMMTVPGVVGVGVGAEGLVVMIRKDAPRENVASELRARFPDIKRYPVMFFAGEPRSASPDSGPKSRGGSAVVSSDRDVVLLTFFVDGKDPAAFEAKIAELEQRHGFQRDYAFKPIVEERMATIRGSISKSERFAFRGPGVLDVYPAVGREIATTPYVKPAVESPFRRFARFVHEKSEALALLGAFGPSIAVLIAMVGPLFVGAALIHAPAFFGWLVVGGGISALLMLDPFKGLRLPIPVKAALPQLFLAAGGVALLFMGRPVQGVWAILNAIGGYKAFRGFLSAKQPNEHPVDKFVNGMEANALINALGFSLMALGWSFAHPTRAVVTFVLSGLLLDFLEAPKKASDAASAKDRAGSEVEKRERVFTGRFVVALGVIFAVAFGVGRALVSTNPWYVVGALAVMSAAMLAVNVRRAMRGSSDPGPKDRAGSGVLDRFRDFWAHPDLTHGVWGKGDPGGWAEYAPRQERPAEEGQDAKERAGSSAEHPEAPRPRSPFEVPSFIDKASLWVADAHIMPRDERVPGISKMVQINLIDAKANMVVIHVPEAGNKWGEAEVKFVPAGLDEQHEDQLVVTPITKVSAWTVAALVEQVLARRPEMPEQKPAIKEFFARIDAIKSGPKERAGSEVASDAPKAAPVEYKYLLRDGNVYYLLTQAKAGGDLRLWSGRAGALRDMGIVRATSGATAKGGFAESYETERGTLYMKWPGVPSARATARWIVNGRETLLDRFDPIDPAVVALLQTPLVASGPRMTTIVALAGLGLTLVGGMIAAAAAHFGGWKLGLVVGVEAVGLIGTALAAYKEGRWRNSSAAAGPKERGGSRVVNVSIEGPAAQQLNRLASRVGATSFAELSNIALSLRGWVRRQQANGRVVAARDPQTGAATDLGGFAPSAKSSPERQVIPVPAVRFKLDIDDRSWREALGDAPTSETLNEAFSLLGWAADKRALGQEIVSYVPGTHEYTEARMDALDRAASGPKDRAGSAVENVLIPSILGAGAALVGAGFGALFSSGGPRQQLRNSVKVASIAGGWVASLTALLMLGWTWGPVVAVVGSAALVLGLFWSALARDASRK